MIIRQTTIQGACLIELEPRDDARGSFARTFCRREFAAYGIDIEVVQCNLATTREAGTIRGLHFQELPAEERKLVRCLVGAVYDVLVDMRPNSATYRTVFAERLDALNRRSIWIPAGVAHGYQALVDGTEFFYMTDQYYAPAFERGVRFSDPSLGIQWPLPVRNVTERDQNWPLLG